MIAKKAAQHQVGRYPVEGAPSDQSAELDHILEEFQHLNASGRSAFLCVIAHELTVAIRSIVYDPPVTDEGLDRVKWMNEALHHLTSCVNPHHRWSEHDEVQLIRDVIADSARHGFYNWVERAIAAATGDVIGGKKLSLAK